jgi:hypothetical protein
MKNEMDTFLPADRYFIAGLVFGAILALIFR